MLNLDQHKVVRTKTIL